eukprot:TRINITY_DN1721_c0_g2_i1.p1 TRINITY_DN1721_c0_g2~~TRINITY_DN1721_c0_g2_i1.p1  ORF type:complete len:377 (-),score=63.17 TRINITY_DN1721_c0_g2_i1:360-1490(-)
MDVSAVLSNINVLRAKHGVSAYQWVDGLASGAQSQAEHVLSTGDWSEVVGQIIWSEGGPGGIGGASDADWAIKATNDWYSEIKDYDFANPVWSDQVGHFTQIVWKASTQVGLGVAKNANQVVVVGHFDPPGNIIGSQQDLRDNVLPVNSSPPPVPGNVQWSGVPGVLKCVSVSDAAVVIGTNAADDPFYWNGSAWVNFTSGKLTQVSTGASGHWGVNAAGQVWKWVNDGWRNVPGQAKHVTSGRDVYAIDFSDRIYKLKTDGTWTAPLDGFLSQIDTNDAGDVWGVNSVNQVWHLVNDAWVNVPGPNGGNTIKHVTTGGRGVWAIDTSGSVYRWASSNSKDGVWSKVPGWLKYIDSGSNSVWGVNDNDQIFYTTTP